MDGLFTIIDKNLSRNTLLIAKRKKNAENSVYSFAFQIEKGNESHM